MLQIRWHGHACFEIRNKLTIVTDPHDGKSIGLPAPSVKGDIILVSHDHYDHNSIKTVEKEGSIIVREVGEKEIENIRIKGVLSYHDEEKGAKRGENIIFKFTFDDINFCHLGDLGHVPGDDIVKELGAIDVLFTPVGGTFTIDAEGAWKTVNKLKPKIAVPMHFKVHGLSLPISDVEPFLNKDRSRVVHVGNEIDIEKEELPKEMEIWVFSL
ncbi:MAG: Zn-dependent hydrolase [Thermoplasmata archaeon]|nr:MAG: Zn-dependent hydrolase [Thermoplasmata archaeon]